nr:hypothetical protein DGKKSRWO_DGKKSRWO_CDS_0086 [uncultured phage]CAI9752263.1 hypothetical protein CVNMHQAP_CVNMHQAP_CDS_0086 [uncultured phage]
MLTEHQSAAKPICLISIGEYSNFLPTGALGVV